MWRVILNFNFRCLNSLTDQEMNVLLFVYGLFVCVYVVLTINYDVLCTQIVCLFSELPCESRENADKFLCDVSRF